MFSWLFGGSNDKVEVPTEKVQEVMEEAHIVKDFYNRMTESCIKKCRAQSIKTDHQIGVNNCLDRCIIKYEEVKEVAEKELQREINSTS